VGRFYAGMQGRDSNASSRAMRSSLLHESFADILLSGLNVWIERPRWTSGLRNLDFTVASVGVKLIRHSRGIRSSQVILGLQSLHPDQFPG
jgi:hypothetical protein